MSQKHDIMLIGCALCGLQKTKAHVAYREGRTFLQKKYTMCWMHGGRILLGQRLHRLPGRITLSQHNVKAGGQGRPGGVERLYPVCRGKVVLSGDGAFMVLFTPH